MSRQKNNPQPSANGQELIAECDTLLCGSNIVSHSA